jgi:hypothetical protein
MKSWITSIKVATVGLAILLATSCGNQAEGLPQINGVKGPLLNIVDGQVMLTFKFLNVNVDAGLKAPIPETRNSYMEFSPNVQDGGMLFVLYLDPEDLSNVDIGIGDGNTLPDGRPVPGIPGGRLEDSLRIDTPWRDISFFYHKELFGIWMPFGFETAGISGYWNMHMNNKNIGFLGLVGNDQVRGYKAGGIVLLKINALKDKKLQSLIKMSKRNPHRIY